MDIFKINIEQWFPNIIGKSYDIINYPDKRDYNCVSYSLGFYDRWLWTNEKCWISEIPRNLKLKSFIHLYEYYGYELCDDSSYEIEYEKIAFYHKNNEPEHAAKQFKDKWRSRINYGIIEHDLDWLCGYKGRSYGDVAFIMKRKIYGKEKEK